MAKFTKEQYSTLIAQIPSLIEKKLSVKEIAEALKISYSATYRLIAKLGLKVPNYHNRLKFNNTVFDIIDTEEKAYWLGFLYADGNVHSKMNVVNITLKKEDSCHLKKLNSFLENEVDIKYHTVNNKYECCRLAICDKHFKERLIELGCVPNKSLVLQFPSIDLFTDPVLIYSFIRGYVDGDGCLTFSRNGRLSIQILGTYQFLSKLSEYFPDKFHLYKIKRLKSNTWTLSCSGNNADFIANVLYKNAHIYLQRKYNRFVVLCRNA